MIQNIHKHKYFSDRKPIYLNKIHEQQANTIQLYCAIIISFKDNGSEPSQSFYSNKIQYIWYTYINTTDNEDSRNSLMTKCSQKKCFLECKRWFQGFEGENKKIEEYIFFCYISIDQQCFKK